ncbi:MAG: cupredoxin family copper-binding protein [Burkholderiaceae bacterium]
MTSILKRTPSPSGAGRRRALGLALAGVACLGWSGSVLGAATTHTVIIEATSYAPEVLTVKRGDTIVWINKDPFPHTVTSAGAFDSKSIPAGGKWKYKARKVGDHAYTCTFHPNMKGRLIIE